MKAKIIVGLAVAAATVLAFVAIGAISSLTLRKPAPEVRFAALSGETFSTSELRGKVALVAFWATYCEPCVREMPALVETHRKFSARGYETVAVAVWRDDPRRVMEFGKVLPFKVALDASGATAMGFGKVRITPTVFLIDKEGRVLARYVGAPDWGRLHKLVERELGG
jgi:peroxiredoxin